MKLFFGAILFFVFASTFASIKISQDKWVNYSVDGINHKGYISAPSKSPTLEKNSNKKSNAIASGKLINSAVIKKPAVIIVHEWWGHNEYAQNRADQLAEKGYVAMSLDMYGDGKTAAHPKDASAMSGAVMSNPTLMEKKFRAALDVLTARPDVDPTQIAAIGYCFGGAVVLSMAKKGLPLKGVVSIHGSLNTEGSTPAGQIKGKVLVLNGADDTFISASSIESFKKDMTQAKVDFEFVNYPNAKHAFSNPTATENGKKFGIPLEYNREADVASWDKTNQFLKTIFK